MSKSVPPGSKDSPATKSESWSSEKPRTLAIEYLGSISYDLRTPLSAIIGYTEMLMEEIDGDPRLSSDVMRIHAAAGELLGSIHNMELQVRTEREQRILAETIHLLTRGRNASLHPEGLYARLLESVDKVLQVPNTAVWQFDEEGLKQVATRGQMYDDGRSPPIDETFLLNRIVRLAEPVLVNGGCSWIGVPMIARSGLVGVLTLLDERSAVFSEREVEVASQLARTAGFAVDNARRFDEMRRQATVDELTNVLNRRHFHGLASEAYAASISEDTPLSVVMLDLDHFKAVNDTYGHAVGDEVLQEVAARWSRAIRDDDLLGRLGGEEFACVLPRTDVHTAATRVAERLRRTICQTPIDTASGPLDITVSLGVACRTDDTADFAAALQRADAALYRAKALGRNRVVSDTGPGHAPSNKGNSAE